METKFHLLSLQRLQQSTKSAHQGKKEEILDGSQGERWQVHSKTSPSTHLLESPVHPSNLLTVTTLSCQREGRTDQIHISALLLWKSLCYSGRNVFLQIVYKSSLFVLNNECLLLNE